MACIRVGIHHKAYRDLHVVVGLHRSPMENFDHERAKHFGVTKDQEETLEKLGCGDFEILVAEKGGVQINLK